MNMQFFPVCALLETYSRILHVSSSNSKSFLMLFRMEREWNPNGLQHVSLFFAMSVTFTVRLLRSRSPEKWCWISLMISLGSSCSDQVLSKLVTFTSVPASVSIPVFCHLGLVKYSLFLSISRKSVLPPDCFVLKEIFLAQARKAWTPKPKWPFVNLEPRLDDSPTFTIRRFRVASDIPRQLSVTETSVSHCVSGLSAFFF